jgi:hypothetical protein
MNSIHRIGLTVAGMVTALVVAGAFVVDGYTSAIATQNQMAADAASQAPTDSPSPAPLEPTIVYVRAAPTPTPKPVPAAPQVVSGGRAVQQPAPVNTVNPPPDPTPTATKTPRPRPTFNGGDD